MHTAPAPFSKPLYVMAKAAGSLCNMHCDYCYYLEKSRLYSGRGSMMMSNTVLEEFIRQYIEAQSQPQVMFTWHGGESLMRSREFYQRVVDLQRRYARGRVQVDNCIQTNGTLITPEWCRFFKDNGWLVGVSVDGPAEYHDAFRHLSANGSSHARVMKGIEMLNDAGVEWNAMATVNSINSEHPVEFYHFFKSIGCRYLQFTPVVERIGDMGLKSGSEPGDDGLAPYSVNASQWGSFLCSVFDQWVSMDVGEIFVQLFDATLANTVGVEPGLCSMARTCGHAAALEFNGDLYSCDHYVFANYRLGNIMKTGIFELMNTERQLRFGADKRDTLPGQCRRCKFLRLCNGECPKNRFSTTEDGEAGLNYLCSGYKQFFEHSQDAMSYMRGELLAGRSPSSVMKLYR